MNIDLPHMIVTVHQVLDVTWGVERTDRFLQRRPAA